MACSVNGMCFSQSDSCLTDQNALYGQVRCKHSPSSVMSFVICNNPILHYPSCTLENNDNTCVYKHNLTPNMLDEFIVLYKIM